MTFFNCEILIPIILGIMGLVTIVTLSTAGCDHTPTPISNIEVPPGKCMEACIDYKFQKFKIRTTQLFGSASTSAMGGMQQNKIYEIIRSECRAYKCVYVYTLSEYYGKFMGACFSSKQYSYGPPLLGVPGHMEFFMCPP